MSRTRTILAVDAGTSVLKATAFRLDGALLATESRRNQHREAPGGLAEQDMGQTWREVAAVISALAERVSATEIVGLAVTGQGDGTWVIDARGEPTGPALLWLDARAWPIVERVRASGAARIAFDESGTGPAACQQSMQLLWLAENRPAQLARAATAMHCKDWLYFNLTGVRTTDPSEGCFTFGSWRTGGYSAVTIEALGVGAYRRLMPPITDGTTTYHGLTERAARLLGLKPGLPVILGYVDILCGALGAGIYGIEPACGVSIIGSTGMNIKLADHDVERPRDAPLSGYRMVFPAPGKTALLQSSLAATLNIDWLLGIASQAIQLAGHEPNPAAMLAVLDRSALQARPAQALYHPYISAAGERGPFTEARARASLAGFDRSLDLPGMMRAIYEGLALGAADCYAAMGETPAVISLSGGASRSEALRGIFAAVLDRPVRTLKEESGGALGAAMIAAVALGIMPDMAECARRWVTPLLGPFEPPDPNFVRVYAPLFRIYQDARMNMNAFWGGFGQLREAFHGR